MKFTVDTTKKILTLLDKVSFKEIAQIKKFIGEDADKCTIEAKEVVKDIHHYDYWLYMPYTRPTITYATTGLSQTLTTSKNNNNSNQYFVNANDNQLSTLTLKSITQ